MWELIEFMVDVFTFLLPGVIMVVNLWSSDISGRDVLDFVYIYFVSSLSVLRTSGSASQGLRAVSLLCP